MKKQVPFISGKIQIEYIVDKNNNKAELPSLSSLIKKKKNKSIEDYAYELNQAIAIDNKQRSSGFNFGLSSANKLLYELELNRISKYPNSLKK